LPIVSSYCHTFTKMDIKLFYAKVTTRPIQKCRAWEGISKAAFMAG